MHEYSYKLSLRIKHPSIDPELITKELEMKPKRSWKAGERRSTPIGTPLDGVYRETYWYTDPTADGERTSDGYILEDCVSDTVDRLSKYSAFFSMVRSDGGVVELYIGTYCPRNYGFEFSPQLMLKLATIGITLTIDIFPNFQKP